MMLRRWWCVLLGCMILLAPLAQAATVHAFLDRDHVNLGDTVTLNIQSDAALGNPDLSSLQKDFEVLGSSRSSSVQIVNGKTTSTTQLGIALKPLHAGTLTIPALSVGGGTTQPLTLQVAAVASGGSGKVGDPVFMQASVLAGAPYVGQQTVYTVRLFYLPDVNGALGDPVADGARLIPLDRDHRYVVNRDGYAYKVIERSWALIPQRSGAISVQGPQFEGQRMGAGFPPGFLNNPNALLNNPNALLNSPLHGFGEQLHASAPVVQFDARAAPASAGKPWLPARNVQLTLTGLPASGKLDASAPLTVTLSVSASGQPAGALPEPELPAIPGARVYPDQTQDSTNDSGEWLQGTRTRSFAIVPERNGALTIPAITLNWWDVAHDHAAQANVQARTLMVTGVTATTQTASAPPASAGVAPTNKAGASAPPSAPVKTSPVASAASVSWRNIALASLALWLLAIAAAVAWWFLRGRKAHDAAMATDTVVRDQPPTSPPVDARALQQHALQAAHDGDVSVCEHALLAWARSLRPEILHVGALRDALIDPAQRDALEALQRARWQGGDAAATCAAVAGAFTTGFAWREERDATRKNDDALPPLYPAP